MFLPPLQKTTRIVAHLAVVLALLDAQCLCYKLNVRERYAFARSLAALIRRERPDLASRQIWRAARAELDAQIEPEEPTTNGTRLPREEPQSPRPGVMPACLEMVDGCEDPGR
jgi:hypothetical protein